MTFKEVNPEMWIPEKDGDSVTGVFLRSQKDVGQNKSMLYHLESDKKPVSVWGSAILDQRMITIHPGDLIKITFKGLGEKKGFNNAPKIFKVERDDGETELETPVVQSPKE